MNSKLFKIDKAGIGKILKSQEMLNMVEEKAKGKAGSDSHVKAFIGFDRAKAIIYPNTKEHPR